MKKALPVIVVAIIMAYGGIELVLGRALRQEKDLLKHLAAIAKLELLGSGYEKTDDENGSIYLSDNTFKGDFVHVKEFMKENGWDYKEQLGAGLVFIRDGEEIVIITKPYSCLYYLWHANKRIVEL